MCGRGVIARHRICCRQLRSAVALATARHECTVYIPGMELKQMLFGETRKAQLLLTEEGGRVPGWCPYSVRNLRALERRWGQGHPGSTQQKGMWPRLLTQLRRLGTSITDLYAGTGSIPEVAGLME